MRKSIKSFTDLEVWQEAHRLSVKVYKLTEGFPKTDQFGLTSQMQRASLSVTSNIAEGFGRESLKDAKHFYIISRGSLIELQNQLLSAKDTKKISAKTFKECADQTVTVHKLINGLIRSVKNNQEPATNNQLTKNL